MTSHPASTTREVEEYGIVYRFTFERGEIVDAEVVEITDGRAAARAWSGVGRVIEHTPAERDGDAERDLAGDR